MAKSTDSARKRLRPTRRAPKQPVRSKRGLPYGIALAVLLLAFVLYFGAKDFVLSMVVRSVEVESGYIEKNIPTDALVMRQEVTFAAPVSGTLQLRAKESERVRVGTPVIQISNPTSARAIDDQIVEVGNRLDDFDKANSQRLTTLLASLSEANQKISITVDEARRAMLSGDSARMVSLDTVLRDFMKKRSDAAVDVARMDTIRGEMTAERERLLELNRRGASVVEAPSPGVVSFYLDGLERIFPATRTEAVTARQVFTSQVHAQEARTGDEVKAGKAIFRVINPEKAMIVMPLKSSDLTDVIVGQTLRVRSDTLGPKMLFVRVTKVTDPGPDGFGTVMGEMQPCPDELMRTRTFKVDLIKERSDGTLIPKECLTQQDGETGVYVIYKTMARFRKVIVKAMDQVNAIVDGVPAGSDVIKNPRFVREGLKVR